MWHDIDIIDIDIDVDVDIDINMVWDLTIQFVECFKIVWAFAPETAGSFPRKSKTFPRDLILGLQIWVYIPDT